MAAPTIKYAYLNPSNQIVVVCRVDHGQSPLKLGVSAENGWTLLFDGATQSLFTGSVADPRPNTVRITPDSGPLFTQTATLYYTAAGSQIQDQSGQLLATILQANAITVEKRLPIIDLIARDIAFRLADITSAAGYVVNLNVIDDLKDLQTIAEGNAWVTYDDPVSEDEAPINHEQFTTTFHIAIATAVSTASDLPLTSKEYQIEAEVMKYLQVDYTRGNLAVDTVPLAPTRADFGEGGWGGISVNVLVRFRTLYGDRFSQ